LGLLSTIAFCIASKTIAPGCTAEPLRRPRVPKRKVGGEPTVDLFCSLISCPVQCKGGLMLLDSSGRPSLWHLSALPGQALAGYGPGSAPCSRDPKKKYTPRQTGNANQPPSKRQVGVLTTRALAEAHTYPQCLPKPSAGTSEMQPHVNYHSSS
jgi:hypothetical protein